MFCNVDPGSVFIAPGRDEHLRAAAGAAPAGARRAARRAPQHLVARAAARALGADRREGLLARARARCAIGIVGKYVDLKESYKCLNEALVHGGIANDVQVTLKYVDSPGGRGAGRRRRCSATSTRCWCPAASASAAPRGRSPRSATRARRRSPSSASASGCRWRWWSSRATCSGWPAPTRSSSTSRRPHPVVSLMESQVQRPGQGRHHAAGRLRAARSRAGSLAAQPLRQGRDQRAPPPPLRGEQRLPEPAVRRRGWSSPATTPSSNLVEMIELPDHPYFVGCQFHPEFKSKPFAPHPLFSRLHPRRAASTGTRGAPDDLELVRARRSARGSRCFVIAGPDVIESRGAWRCATRALLQEICRAARACRFVFKCSFDKANRTSGELLPRAGAGRGAARAAPG